MALLISKTQVYENGKVRDRATGKLVDTQSERAAKKQQRLAAKEAAAQEQQRLEAIPTIAQQAAAAERALFTNWRVANADPNHQVISNVSRVDEGDAPTWYVYLCPHATITAALRSNLLSGTNCTITDERSTPNGTILVVTLNVRK